jgi:penicillin-binding protein 2
MFGRNEKIPSFKFTVVQYMVLAVFLLLAFGLWRLQISGSDEYSVRAEQNRIRSVPILAPRGKIYDRDGLLVVDNYPSFSALLLRDQGRDLNADAPRIALGLHISVDEIRDKVRRYQLARVPAYEPIRIKDDITPDERAFIESHRDEFSELETIMAYRRLYPQNGFMAHLIGYVGEVSEDMLRTPRFEVYAPGDIVGQSGLEQYYNDVLGGKNGSRRVMVDSKGREVKGVQPLLQEPPVVGKSLHLTIDLDVQKAAEMALEGKNGAIVALDPRTGEVLAMASWPTFDPNAFAVRVSRKEWNRLVTDPAHPLMNKAIQAQLAPGSTFKIIMSVAGLQEGPAQTLHVNCGGGATFYGHYYHCHGVHGSTDISKAITQSCDTFFYTLAERLGITKIAKWATALGLGSKTGIDLPNEASGIMPSEEWKAKNYRQKWYAGDTIPVGIGQGAVVTTPLQLARAIGGIAMDGVLYRPHVVAPDQLPPEFKKMAAESADVVRVPLDPQNWITITNAMVGVVAPGGTASSAHIEGVDFAGKTGTAQVVSHAFREGKQKLGSEYNDNVWFVGVSPRRNPEIVVAVLLEGGQSSPLAGRTAAQVVRAFVEKQRRIRKNPSLFSDKNTPDAVPMAALWNSPAPNHDAQQPADSLHGGTVLVKMGKPSVLKRAVTDPAILKPKQAALGIPSADGN